VFLKQIQVKNFRLLMDYNVVLNEGLTLFVGINNVRR